MAQITCNTKLDVTESGSGLVIMAKQGDGLSRFVRIRLTDQGKNIDVAEESQVLINARRADGEARSFEGVANSDGTVTVPLTAWMLENAQPVICDVSALGADGSRLTTTTFAVTVEATISTTGEIITGEDPDVATRLLSTLQLTTLTPQQSSDGTYYLFPAKGGKYKLSLSSSVYRTGGRWASFCLMLPGSNGSDGGSDIFITCYAPSTTLSGPFRFTCSSALYPNGTAPAITEDNFIIHCHPTLVTGKWDVTVTPFGEARAVSREEEAINAKITAHNEDNAAHADIRAALAGKADAAQISRAGLMTALGAATAEAAGYMSAADKARLDALSALLGSEADADTVVNTISEVLTIFENYPEGDLVAQALAGKLDAAHATSDTAHADIRAALAGKVEKLGASDKARLYAVTAAGADTYKNYDSDASNYSIVARNSQGYFNVKEPTSNIHPATKKYVDQTAGDAVATHNESNTAHADIRNALSGKEAAGTAASAVSTHNGDSNAHADIRTALDGKLTKQDRPTSGFRVYMANAQNDVVPFGYAQTTLSNEKTAGTLVYRRGNSSSTGAAGTFDAAYPQSDDNVATKKSTEDVVATHNESNTAHADIRQAVATAAGFVRASTPSIQVKAGGIYDILIEWRDSYDYYGASFSRTVLVNSDLQCGAILNFEGQSFDSAASAAGHGSGPGNDVIFIPTDADGGAVLDGENQTIAGVRQLVICADDAIGVSTPDDTYCTLYYREHPVL